MSVKIENILEKIHTWYDSLSSETRKKILNVLWTWIPPLLILVSLAQLIFGLWQLDIIEVGVTWGLLSDQILWFLRMMNSGLTSYSQAYFQCWSWKTTVGSAYDTLYGIIFLSWWMQLAGWIGIFTRIWYKLKITIKALDMS